MRPIALLLGVFLLTGCARDREATVALGDPCESSAQCPIDATCEGCSEEDRQCLSGCTTDDDCASGTCTAVECTTCPCPGTCE